MNQKKRNKQNMLIQYKWNEMKYWNMRCNNSPQLSLHRAGMIFSNRPSMLLVCPSKIWHVLLKKNPKNTSFLVLWIILWPSDHVNHEDPMMEPPCCTSPVGSVSVLICSGGLVHLFGQPPRPLRAAATVRSGQPSLLHLAVCPRQVLEGRKQSGHSTYRHIHTLTPTQAYTHHTRSQRVTVALVYPSPPTLPQPPFILSF